MHKLDNVKFKLFPFRKISKNLFIVIYMFKFNIRKFSLLYATNTLQKKKKKKKNKKKLKKKKKKKKKKFKKK